MIKFVKDRKSIPVYVTGSGYGWFEAGGKEHTELFVNIHSFGQDSISISTKDVPALVSALQNAVAEAERLCAADLKEHKKRISYDTTTSHTRGDTESLW